MQSVSAIVPTRQRPALLARALRSIAAQQTAPGEVVVVNDGPETDTRAIHEAVAASGCTCVVLIANSHATGPSGARNAGAAHARGDWLAFLDDDDEWLPSYLRVVGEQLEARGLDVVCTDLLYRYDDGSERPGKLACDALVLEPFLTRNPGLIGSNLVIRRSLFAAIGGFDESLLSAEDMDFGIRLCLHGGVRYEPLRQRLVRHHHHAGPRLCTPGTDAMRAGVRRFYELHAPRMTPGQREEYGRNMRRLWGIDEYGRLV
jgi:glycosyltransferase involved in cell wall biosynthesis